jgi:hypothetical protein
MQMMQNCQRNARRLRAAQQQTNYACSNKLLPHFHCHQVQQFAAHTSKAPPSGEHPAHLRQRRRACPWSLLQPVIIPRQHYFSRREFQKSDCQVSDRSGRAMRNQENRLSSSPSVDESPIKCTLIPFKSGTFMWCRAVTQLHPGNKRHTAMSLVK